MVAVNLFVMGSLNNKCLVIFLVLLIFTEGFPGGSMVKNLPASTGDEASISGLGRFPWRRKWQPTSMFLPGKSIGQRRLAGYSHGVTRVGLDLVTKHTHTLMIYYLFLVVAIKHLFFCLQIGFLRVYNLLFWTNCDFYSCETKLLSSCSVFPLVKSILNQL